MKEHLSRTNDTGQTYLQEKADASGLNLLRTVESILA